VNEDSHDTAARQGQYPRDMTPDPIFAADVAEYLQRTPRQLPSRYFYDALGSALFEAICALPWYRITRAESALLARHARAILDAIDAPFSVAELGCGSGDKLATLIASAAWPIEVVQLVDISATALRMACDRLEALPIDRIVTHQHTYDEGLLRLDRDRAAGPMLVLFLGSNIGNFDPPADGDLLRRIRACLRPGDALLLGTDLVKPECDLLLAYDDPLQVTAAFNRNLLRRINDELGGTFDLDTFAHRAIWNARASRVEMHLVSLRRQAIRIRDAALDLAFEPNDWIWTESSYKYTACQVVQHGLDAGFSRAQQWVDDEARFALTRFLVEI
jgi:L-histidine N-alpha-methyltransferase